MKGAPGSRPRHKRHLEPDLARRHRPGGARNLVHVREYPHGLWITRARVKVPSTYVLYRHLWQTGYNAERPMPEATRRTPIRTAGSPPRALLSLPDAPHDQHDQA